MAKWANDLFMDAALDRIKTGAGTFGPCNKMTVCSTQPTTYTEGNATYALADVAMTGTDFTIGNGDTNGRKVAVAAKSSILIDTSGTAQHIALLDTVNSVLMYVTTCTSQALVANASNTVSVPTWDIEIADPT